MGISREWWPVTCTYCCWVTTFPRRWEPNSGSCDRLAASRRLELDWRTFIDAGELRSLLRRDLLQALLQRAGEFGLDIHELERLVQLAEEKPDERDKGGTDESSRGEAGRSGVILGREIWEEER
jgi:hypothetical protein